MENDLLYDFACIKEVQNPVEKCFGLLILDFER
jgi:hypothetical protein